ncbi:hypothetical protein [Labilibaculum antarcticum]|uniref:Uncharacterized protein n=1 Tax=Labilibaculum antarcticum TaxID=1717717 RepID=A0A1Y1CI30_9BACT|nr:hypothetical protein [Labilibaculum antarcticum]BAX80039.1 hypothetical protein ALGA_1664 [Labilibaculum antarcticum]
MRKIIILILTLLPLISSAQISFNTGNLQFDSDLNTINANANLDFGAFQTDLSIGYNVPEKEIEHMRGTLNMAPGEIYLALEISKVSNRSVDDVICNYRKHKSRGWGYIAKESGVRPGSAKFHRLKNHSHHKKNKGHKHSKNHGKHKKKHKKR